MTFAIFFLAGVTILALGGEALIRGALGIANRLGISPLLAGLIIVGFGTSMPELVVSVDASISGLPDIAIGNVVGSNIANILLILGLCALITPLTTPASALGRDALVMLVASFSFIGLSWGTDLGRLDGLFLILALLAYLGWAYWSEKGKSTPSGAVLEAEASEVQSVPKSLLWSIAATLLGLLLLIAGSQVLLKGAVGIAQQLGVSDAVVGLTLVAVGTSLPELTISVVAAMRKHVEVAVGNVLGSNIFNSLGILGVSALTHPLEVSIRIANFDQWVLVGVSALLYVLLFTKRQLSRLEGCLLLSGYFIYVFLSYNYFSQA